MKTKEELFEEVSEICRSLHKDHNQAILLIISDKTSKASIIAGEGNVIATALISELVGNEDLYKVVDNSCKITNLFRLEPPIED